MYKGEAYCQVSLSDGVDELPARQARFSDELSEATSCQLQDEPHSPLQSFAGHNHDLQLIRTIHTPDNGDLKEAEKQAMVRMKNFCARILKTLAPPLLREVESASMLRAAAEPFTPCRSSRFTATSTPVSRAPKKTTAEAALLKALGVSPDNLTADDEAIKDLKQLFDSPLRDRQIHVLAAIFGKTVLARDEILRTGSVEISVSA
jgi:hypothetical protein